MILLAGNKSISLVGGWGISRAILPIILLLFGYSTANMLAEPADVEGIDANIITQKPAIELILRFDEKEGLQVSAKNISPFPIILSRAALLKAHLLWFIKINDKIITSGVEVHMYTHPLPTDFTFQDKEILLKSTLPEIEKNSKLIIFQPGETAKWAVSDTTVSSSRIFKVLDLISKNAPIDLTVSYTDLIVGMINNNKVIPVKGELILFSKPLVLDHSPISKAH